MKENAAAFMAGVAFLLTAEHCEGSSTCLDTPDWVDEWDDGCDWYETHDDPGCPTYGNFGGNLGSMNDNCCHCKETGSTNSYPTTTAASLTYIPTNFPTLGSSECPTLPKAKNGKFWQRLILAH